MSLARLLTLGVLLLPTVPRAFCLAPSAPAGYQLSNDTACLQGGSLGTSCSVSCATGYQGAAATLSCQATPGGDAWTPFTGCVAVSCGTPTSPAGYTIGAGCNTYACSRAVSCNSGVGYVGAPVSITCAATGTWSAPSGCALADCGVPSPPAGYRATCGASTLVYAMCSYACDGASGYVGTPSASSTACQVVEQTPTWSPSASSLTGCERTCGPPPAMTGYVTQCSSGHESGDECAITCNMASGYIGEPATRAITCAADGTWSAVTNSGCTLAECGDPSPPVGYTATCNEGTSFDAECSYACDADSGYVGTASPASARCQLDQTWSSAAASLTGCALAQCGAVSPPVGYIASCSSTAYGASCEFACDETSGYEGTPSETSTECQLSETWSVSAASLTGCTLHDCGALNFENADVAGCTASSHYGEACTVSCLDGFTGTPTATCTMTGWARSGACAAAPSGGGSGGGCNSAPAAASLLPILAALAALRVRRRRV